MWICLVSFLSLWLPIFFYLLRAGVVGRGGINSLGRKKIIYQLQTGLTAKKRRIAPCWPTRCRLESFYRINVTNTDIQLIEPQLRDPRGPEAKGDFGGMRMLIDRPDRG